MAIAVVLILLVVGSVIFHFWSPWWFTPIASNWGMIDDTVNLTFWVTGIVFVLINLFMAYCIIRFRHRKGNKAAYEPENKKLEIWLTVITSIGVAALLAPGLLVWAKVVTVPEGAMEVEAVGQQWAWSYRYPGNDGVFGTTSIRHVTAKNPFGVDPDDPNGQDDVLVDGKHMHLPMGQPVKLLLRSKDVLHNFTVPQFRVKMDLVPGMVSYIWLTPTRTGKFDVLCEELCGLAHFAMRSKVVVQEQNDFDAWLAAQPTFASATERMEPDLASGQASYAVCGACHGAQGEGNAMLNAPKLAGQNSWYIEQQLKNYKSGVRGYHEGDIYGRQMAPMAGTLVDDKAIANVSAYIATLPEKRVSDTIIGNTRRGKDLYRTCGTCHGDDGRGIWATHAPRLKNMDDWYLKRQLENFKAGIRGSHPDDPFGQQMVLMSPILGDEQAIDDLVAYLGAL